MQHAQDQDRQGHPGAARQAQEQAAQALDRATHQAEQAARQLVPQAGKPQPDSPGDAQAGRQLQQAQGEMSQARGQLAQGQTRQAGQAMQQAAQALARAAQQLGQPQIGPANANARSRPAGALGQGAPDLSMFGKDLQQYAGKPWGELPGELRTRIIQDVKARYGADYARIIKLYFEQIADKK
jgi:hypothetical protein